MLLKVHGDEPTTPAAQFLHKFRSRVYYAVDTFVLDAGCGAGRNSYYAACEEGFLTVGYDFSKAMIGTR